MEIRKVQKTGGASLIVTLPKKWVIACKLEDKDVVKISFKQHALIVQPILTKKSILKSFIDASNKSQEIVSRELIANYISGIDEIVIKSNKFTPEERNKIRSICNILIGFELLNATTEEIIIKNIFDQTKFPLSQSIEKMFTITKSMLEDAYLSLKNQDIVLAQDVINRDIEVDKLHIAITRQLYVNVRKDLFYDDPDMDEIDLIFYQNISTQLERIADHAVKIARTVSGDDISGTPISTSHIVISNLASALELSRKIVENLDNEIAHNILDQSRFIEDQIYNKKTRKHKNSFAWDVLEDSLDRIRGYIMNMAELTIDQAVLKKGHNIEFK